VIELPVPEKASECAIINAEVIRVAASLPARVGERKVRTPPGSDAG